MDDIDRAQEVEDRHRAAAISARRTVLAPTGECHNCAASVPPGVNFCDADCRDDYDRYQNACRRNGTTR